MFKVVNWKTGFVYKTYSTERGAKIAAGKLNAENNRPSPSGMCGQYTSYIWEVQPV